MNCVGTEYRAIDTYEELKAIRDKDETPAYEFKLFRPFDAVKEPCKKTQKENTMAYGNCTTSTAAITVAAAPVDEAKKYLERRMSDVYWEKRAEIEAAFRPISPKTGKEALKWLKDGNYHFDKYFLKRIELDEVDEDHSDFDNWDFAHSLRWGKTPFDPKERDKAYDDLETAKTKALDVILVVTDEEKRLEALRSFEAYKVQ